MGPRTRLPYDSVLFSCGRYGEGREYFSMESSGLSHGEVKFKLDLEKQIGLLTGDYGEGHFQNQGTVQAKA